MVRSWMICPATSALTHAISRSRRETVTELAPIFKHCSDRVVPLRYRSVVYFLYIFPCVSRISTFTFSHGGGSSVLSGRRSIPLKPPALERCRLGRHMWKERDRPFLDTMVLPLGCNNTKLIHFCCTLYVRLVFGAFGVSDSDRTWSLTPVLDQLE